MDLLATIGMERGASNRVAQSLAQPAGATRAAAAAAASTTGTSTDGSTITSNDFLTLLVTEMKNQDPTQPTDPNAYIQQLVGVNSLQQLIAINKELTPPPASGAPPATINPISTT